MKLTGKQYKFDETQFSKLYIEEYWSQDLKEKIVGVSWATSNTTTCTQILEKTIKGLNLQSEDVLTRTTVSRNSKYPDNHKYTCTSGGNTKNYRIDNSSGTHKFVEVTS